MKKHNLKEAKFAMAGGIGNTEVDRRLSVNRDINYRVDDEIYGERQSPIFLSKSLEGQLEELVRAWAVVRVGDENGNNLWDHLTHKNRDINYTTHDKYGNPLDQSEPKRDRRHVKAEMQKGDVMAKNLVKELINSKLLNDEAKQKLSEMINHLPDAFTPDETNSVNEAIETLMTNFKRFL